MLRRVSLIGGSFFLSESQQDSEKKEVAQKKPESPQPVAPPTSTPQSTPAQPPAAKPPIAPVVPPKPVVTVPPKPVVAAPPKPAPAVVGPRPPTVPAKPEETKQQISRRNFLRGIVIVGGLVAIVQFGGLGPFLQGSVGSTVVKTQVILDSITGAPITTSDVPVNSAKAFIFPRTGQANIDNDTFRQCIVMHLPSDYVAPGSLSAKDPISGDTFVALSRVCVHLWCLWSYVPADRRGECPCHGSQYVPGGVAGSLGASNPGIAVAGPASLQTPPNNQLPVITLSIAADGTISATGIVGQIGCGQKC
jgi:rieske iron-sulfur protein